MGETFSFHQSLNVFKDFQSFERHAKCFEFDAPKYELKRWLDRSRQDPTLGIFHGPWPTVDLSPLLCHATIEVERLR